MSWPRVSILLSPPSTTVKDSLVYPAAYPQRGKKKTSPSSLSWSQPFPGLEMRISVTRMLILPAAHHRNWLRGCCVLGWCHTALPPPGRPGWIWPRFGMGVLLTSQYLCGIFKCCGDIFSTSWPPKGAGRLLKVALPLIHWWWSWLALKPAHLPSHHLLCWKLSAAPGLLAENFQVLLSQPFWGLKCRDISQSEVPIGKCGQMPWRHPLLWCYWYLFLHVWTGSV